ncbi:UNVERIFIED_CONTAM: Transcriptional regulator STERILE APETALA [Sesamum latifolium]|uniref:Transcriptional regulator STERILE APETALA n=1 Tax=Sesamum latifolium TaxID=2727402 RepID=A0AAW2VF17_9LAMI
MMMRLRQQYVSIAIWDRCVLHGEPYRDLNFYGKTSPVVSGTLGISPATHGERSIFTTTGLPAISDYADAYTPPCILSRQLTTTTTTTVSLVVAWRSRIITLQLASLMVQFTYSTSQRGSMSTFYPQHRDRLGRFSSAVSGIILSDVRIVFATLDGDIHTTDIEDEDIAPLRRAHLGDVVNHGALVDFTGCNRWWVGLYAGVPGHALRIWNSETEELVFVGGTLTDPQSVMGWHLLTELNELIGRVRVTGNNMAVACTRLRVIVFDLQNQGIILREEESQRRIMVGLFDANNESALITDDRGVASVRLVEDLEEKCWFRLRGRNLRRTLGCVNSGYGLVRSAGEIRVYEIEQGQYLYNFRERIGDCNALIADEKHVAACSSDGTIHLWYFGAE